MVRAAVVFLWLTICALDAAAQGAGRVQLAIEPRSGTVNDSFLFSVIIEGGGDVRYPYLLGGDDFKLALIGPQTSMRIENGVTTTQTAYNYRLLPKRSGALQTPGAEVEIDGVKYRAQPLEVQIAEGPAQVQKVDKYFVVQSFDKRSAYVGEQVIGTIELYTSVELDDLQYSDLSFDGFWSEELGKSETFERVIDGKRYTVLRIRRALYPLVPGKISVPARELHAKAVQGVRRRRPPSGRFDFDTIDPFSPSFLGDFFGQKVYEPIALRSNVLSIEIKPLPPVPSGLPAPGPQVLVGHTSVALAFEPGGIKVGESKNVRITVTSYGNIGTYKKLPLEIPPNVKSYDEAPTISPIESDGKLILRKTFSTTLVPTAPGEVALPPIEVTYFDPAAEQYKVARSGEARFAVAGEAIASSAPRAAPTSASAPVQQTTAETEPSPKPEDRYEERSRLGELARRISPSLVLLVVALAAACAYASLLMYRLAERKRPARELMARLDKADSLDALASAFGDFLSTRLEVPAADVRSAAKSRIRDPEVLFAVQSALDMFDELRYGSRSADPALLSGLEATIRSVATSL